MSRRPFSAALVSLSALLALGAAAPVAAQAAPLGSGGGQFVHPASPFRDFAFSCTRLPNGTVSGYAFFSAPSIPGSHVVVQITSAVVIGGQQLAVAGPVVSTANTPFVVGQTAFFTVEDEGPLGDAMAGLGGVPPQFGNLTIQEIINLTGPPPPEAFAPIVSGGIRVF